MNKTMKILYIANIRLPTEKAHGIQIMKMCEAFARAGHDVELVVPTRRTPITEDAFAYYGVEKIFKITTLRTPDFVRFGRFGFLFSALCFSERVRWLKQFWSADIVYSRDAFVLAQYVLLGRRTVFEVHSSPSRLSKFVSRMADSVVVISNGLKEAYVSSGIPEKKIMVAPDAVGTHLFDNVLLRESEREKLGFPKDEKIVVYTGHLYARKGVDVLADAATYLQNVRFFFVGGTLDDIEQFRSRWGNQKNIHVTGHVEHAQVPRYLRAADVLVIPNSAKNKDSKYFTSPMKLFEYMASGTPIVASDVPAIREILNERSAFLVEPDNPRLLAEGIKNILKDYSFASTISKQALEDAKNYTWQKRAESILDFIKF